MKNYKDIKKSFLKDKKIRAAYGARQPDFALVERGLIKRNQQFVPGLKIGELFFKKIIRPILCLEFPTLKYSAALIGEGSEVLGYDTLQSTDHCWGPRMMLFFSEADYQRVGKRVLETVTAQLPKEFMGYPTKMDCPVKNTIDIFTIKSFFEKNLALDPSRKSDVFDWLTLPSQKLLEVTSGIVYHDDVGLKKARNKFAYYPDDVWLYILSCQWKKISEEESFVGRCGDVGDELGSQIVAARIVRELMKLCFLLEKKYVPYSKWFGTAFAELQSANMLSPLLRKTLLASSWKDRERWLSKAYEVVAMLHNGKKITKQLQKKVSKYHDRPYLVLHADKFAEAVWDQIKSKEVRAIKTNIGSIDQFVDNTDALAHPRTFKKVKVWSGA